MATQDDVRINIIADTKKAITNMRNFAIGIGAAILVARKLIKVGADMVNAYAEQEQAEARLAAAIRSTGREASINQASLEGLASSLQKVTIYGDEATISAMAMLQQLSNLDQEGLEAVTPAMLDFASAMNVDINVAAQLIGKTLGSTTNALARYGVVVDATAEPTEKLAEITQALNDKFGGTAEAVGATTLGAIEQYKNAMGDLKESGGSLIARFLEPAITKFAQLATTMNENIAEREAFNEVMSGSGTDFESAIKRQEKNVGDAMAEVYKWNLMVVEAFKGQSEWLESIEFKRDAYIESLQAEEATLALLVQQQGEYLEGQDELAEAAEIARKEAEAVAADAAENKKILEDLATAYEGTEKATIEAMEAQIAFYESLNLVASAAMRDELVKELKASLEDLTGVYDVGGAVLQDYNIQGTALMGLLPKVSSAQETLNDMVDEGTLSAIRYNEQLELEAANLRANAIYVTDLGEAWRGYKDDVEGVRVESAEMEEHLKRLADLADAGKDAMYGMAIDGLQALGAGMVDAESGVAAFVDAIKTGMSTVLKVLGEYALSQAALLIPGLPLTAGSMAAYLAAGAAAYVAAGAVTAMADGGIVNRPTLALIGEAGPEAVVPLGKSGGMGGIVIHQHVYGNLLTQRHAARLVLQEAANQSRRY